MSQDITCTACNTMDIGTVIREDDNIAVLTLQGSEAEELMNKLTDLARSIESEPCEISVEPVQGAQGDALRMSFVFSCAAEKLIFDMRAAKLR